MFGKRSGWRSDMHDAEQSVLGYARRSPTVDCSIVCARRNQGGSALPALSAQVPDFEKDTLLHKWSLLQPIHLLFEVPN